MSTAPDRFPMVNGMTPARGMTAGGSRITFHGQRLNIFAPLGAYFTPSESTGLPALYGFAYSRSEIVESFYAQLVHSLFQSLKSTFASLCSLFYCYLLAGAVLGIFIWVGQSKAKQILGRSTEVVYVGIMGITRAVWLGGHGLPVLIARTASAFWKQ